MRLILLTTAAVLALCSAASANADPSGAKPDFPATQNNIRIATDNSGNAPGGTGVEQSTKGQGVTNKDTSTMPGESSKVGSPTGMQPGTGVEDSVQGEGATNKQGVNETKSGQSGTNMGGASAGNAPGGTGVETSSQSEGSKNKTTN